MSTAISFNEILESADRLSLDEQESLIDVIRSRIATRRCLKIASLISSAREEFKDREMRHENSEEIMQALISYKKLY